MVVVTLPTAHSVATRFNPSLVDGEAGKEESQLEKESEDDANSGEKAVGSQRWQDGGASDEKDDDVGGARDCDPHTCFSHGSSNSLG